MNDEKTRVMDAGPGDNGPRDSRTRWLIGVLLALVVGLGVGLLIVAADDSQDDETTVTVESTEEETETEATETDVTKEETEPEETTITESTEPRAAPRRRGARADSRLGSPDLARPA